MSVDPRLPKGQCAERNHAQIQNSKFKVCPSGTLREQKKKKDASPQLRLWKM
jgi:hypothetical protein